VNVTDQDGVGSPPSKTRLLIDVLWWYPLRALFLAVEAWRQPRRAPSLAKACRRSLHGVEAAPVRLLHSS
jgi:hypothetical protein